MKIKSNNKRNQITLVVLGGIGLFLGLYLFIQFSSLFVIGLIIFILSIICGTVGLAKISEPDVTFVLDEIGMIYFHNKGEVKLLWNDIQRIDIPKMAQVKNGIIDYDNLPYIGFKLKHLNAMLTSVSPRLAMFLYSNQKQLLTLSLTQNQHEELLEKYLTQEFSSLTVDGHNFTGVKAMFGHRCQTLNTELGFHFYIPIDALDREPQSFVKMLRDTMTNLP